MHFIWIPFWVVAFAWALVVGAMLILLHFGPWRVPLREEFRLLPLFLCSLLLLRFGLFPFARIGGRIQDLALSFQSPSSIRLNLVPFVHLVNWEDLSFSALLNLWGNILLFMPVGLAYAYVRRGSCSTAEVALVGALASLALELMQLAIPARVTDIDDLALNVLGAAIGNLIYCAVSRVVISMGSRT